MNAYIAQPYDPEISPAVRRAYLDWYRAKRAEEIRREHERRVHKRAMDEAERRGEGS